MPLAGAGDNGSIVNGAPASAPAGDAASPTHERLPDHRHQPPDDPSKHQHQRLIAAIATLCAERGYANLGIADIAAHAAASETTFHSFFESKDACLLAAHKHYSAALLAAIDSSCPDPPEWPESLRLGIRAALAFLSKQPEAAQLLSVGILSCSAEGAARYRATIDAIAARLRSASRQTGPQYVDSVLVAGVLSSPLIIGYRGEDRATDLLRLESELVEIILTFTEAQT